MDLAFDGLMRSITQWMDESDDDDTTRPFSKMLGGQEPKQHHVLRHKYRDIEKDLRRHWQRTGPGLTADFWHFGLCRVDIEGIAFL